MSLPTIAVDAMGGDEGVRVMIEGAALARRRHEASSSCLSGTRSGSPARWTIIPIFAVQRRFSMRPKPWLATKAHAGPAPRQTTSMGLAIDAVKRGEAGAAVSAGNTGALMAMAKLALRTLPGIDRPALAALLPTLGAHDLVMLDLGANTDCDARNLFQFALMGAAYARIVHGLDSPRVRLLNIGTEETKGTDDLRDAAALLKHAAASLALTFDGFTEADKLSRGDFDVVVTDGFSGNIALKAMEGAARFVGDLLRRSFSSSLRSKIGFLISRPATETLKHHLDPNNHNGAVFLGLNGVVVKSHGSASAIGVANAIGVATRLLEENLIERIAADVAAVDPDTIASRPGAAWQTRKVKPRCDSSLGDYRQRLRSAATCRLQCRNGADGRPPTSGSSSARASAIAYRGRGRNHRHAGHAGRARAIEAAGIEASAST
jgi:glycerol-3-phosphate acyltransferase PlsX